MNNHRRIHIIACRVLALDLKRAAERAGVEASTEFLPGGLHNTPHELRRRLQSSIDRASTTNPSDRIAIGYGVCGLGTIGLHARTVPLAIPRVQDCIALFLGSDAAYREQFARYPGTYYISAGWVEEKVLPRSMESAPPLDRARAWNDDGLDEKCGEHADEVCELVDSWQRNYQRAAFIDTGVRGPRASHAEIAREMARRFGWIYETIPGSTELLERLLTEEETSDEVLVVPPHYVTVFDAVRGGLKAVPLWERASSAERRHVLVFESDGEGRAAEGSVRLGLGIDAGGTYTDTVIYDFSDHAVLQKAKALTTTFDYTVGIEEALGQLDADHLRAVDLVALSTTLATNAIAEGRGQTVGLLIMPPYGLFDETDITHRPLAVIDGRMEIDGSEIAPVDPGQVCEVVADLIERHDVGAFAVCGYASCSNPAHELQVKEIIRDSVGMSVTCGHEVSELLDYRVRAQTAALNGRIIPRLEQLIDHVRAVLRRRGIDAPVMVVKSDGSLMSVEAARERPIETILSGPAASVAGARFLSGAPDAIVLDIGGTTTDTARIKEGAVQVCAEGARVGAFRTHVKALDMRTVGLGGDSSITLERRELRIGPRRVAPVSWVAARHADAHAALGWIERHLDSFTTSTAATDLVVLSGRRADFRPDRQERSVLDLLGERPHSVHELASCVLGNPWRTPPLERLEERQLIQRCGLTPTDLLHVLGEVDLWDGAAAGLLCDQFARLSGTDREAFARRAIERVIHAVAVELLKTQMAERVDSALFEASPGAQALIENLLRGGDEEIRVRVELRRPVIGIGAPVHAFLPRAAEILEAECIIPPDADVANAIGAITSSVVIHRQVTLAPNETGRYTLAGLPDAPTFGRFEEANAAALERLRRLVRDDARLAGTSQTRVEITVEDRIGYSASGEAIFLGRTLEARLSGRPDLARLAPPP